MADQNQSPQSSNQYSVAAQPFSESLLPQSYVSTAPPPSGHESKGGAIASIADKFLEGFSKGRKQQFDRQENERSKLNQDVNEAFQRVAQSDLTEEQKAQFNGKLDALKIAALKQHVDQSKDKQNPQLNVLRSVFDAMMGPTKKRYEFGPEQIHQVLADVYKGVSSPENQRTAQVETAVKGVTEQANKILKAAQTTPDGGHDPNALVTSKEVMADPAFMESFQKAISANKGKVPESLQLFINQIDQNDKLQGIKDDFGIKSTQDAQKVQNAIATYTQVTGHVPDERARLDILQQQGVIAENRLTANAQFGKATLPDGTVVDATRDPRTPGLYTNALTGEPLGSVAKFELEAKPTAAKGPTGALKNLEEANNILGDNTGKYSEAEKQAAQQFINGRQTSTSVTSSRPGGIDPVTGNPANLVTNTQRSTRTGYGNVQTAPPPSATPSTNNQPATPKGQDPKPPARQAAALKNPSPSPTAPVQVPTTMTVAQSKAALPFVRVIREANSQLMGDNGLKTFATLADNPDSQRRLGTALQLALDAQEGVTKEGSFGKLITNASGLTEAVAQATAGVRQQAIASLTPEERDYFDAAMSTYSAVAGLRALTGANASQFSVKRIEAEVPLIGINSTDTAQFYDQMGRVSKLIAAGAKPPNVPQAMWPKEEYQGIQNAPAEFNRLKEEARKGKSSKQTATPPKEAAPDLSKMSIQDVLKQVAGGK